MAAAGGTAVGAKGLKAYKAGKATARPLTKSQIKTLKATRTRVKTEIKAARFQRIQAKYPKLSKFLKQRPVKKSTYFQYPIKEIKPAIKPAIKPTIKQTTSKKPPWAAAELKREIRQYLKTKGGTPTQRAAQFQKTPIIPPKTPAQIRKDKARATNEKDKRMVDATKEAQGGQGVSGSAPANRLAGGGPNTTKSGSDKMNLKIDLNFNDFVKSICTEPALPCHTGLLINLLLWSILPQAQINKLLSFKSP